LLFSNALFFLLSSFSEFKALSSFVAGDGDPPPFSLLSSLLKLKAHSSFVAGNGDPPPSFLFQLPQSFDSLTTNDINPPLFVATLALGLRPRQKVARLRAKWETREHSTCSRECKECERMNPHTPK
jgi:hypothetical protein